ALPTEDNARHLLAHQSVINGECGTAVADYLIEYLPFETQTSSITQSVNRLLTAGLAAPRHVDQWWTRAQRSGAYMLGFLQAIPDDLPDTRRNTHPLLDSHRASLTMLGNADSPVARQLLQIFSAAGQAYIRAARLALCKSEDQETMIASLENIACYFELCRIDGTSVGQWEEIILSVDETPGKMTDAEHRVIEHADELHTLVRAMSILSLVSYEIVRPVLSNTTASGSLMRRKLTPVVSPLDNQLAVLLG
ncbi:MAG: hypothetical protein AAF404_05025, partial [Pseudomonadota bacterium]